MSEFKLEVEFNTITADIQPRVMKSSLAKPFPWKLTPSIDEPDLGMLPEPAIEWEWADDEYSSSEAIRERLRIWVALSIRVPIDSSKIYVAPPDL